MGDADFREFARVHTQVALVVMAVHFLLFGALVGMLAPARRYLAARTGMRGLAWFGFGILAFFAYIATAISSWFVHDHLLFWATGQASLCHLVGIVGKIGPLAAGAVGVALERARHRALVGASGAFVTISGVALAAISVYRWISYPEIDYSNGFMTLRPQPETLIFVIAAGAIATLAGALLCARSFQRRSIAQ